MSDSLQRLTCYDALARQTGVGSAPTKLAKYRDHFGATTVYTTGGRVSTLPGDDAQGGAVQAERAGGRKLLLAARALVVAAAAVAFPAAAADSFSGQVVAVHDGDTISVMNGDRAERVRLEGIDCPEQGQDFGARAKQATSELVFRRVVVVERRGRDRYRRTLGRVFVDGLDVNRELVRQGFAWHFTRHSSEAALAAAEAEARSAKRGLWSLPDQVCPWEWRSERMRQPAR